MEAIGARDDSRNGYMEKGGEAKNDLGLGERRTLKHLKWGRALVRGASGRATNNSNRGAKLLVCQKGG